jgi:hypothetical protein
MRTSRLAEAAALLRAYDEADEEAVAADYASGGFDSDPPGAEQRFRDACARLRGLRQMLLELGVHEEHEEVQ